MLKIKDFKIHPALSDIVSCLTLTEFDTPEDTPNPFIFHPPTPQTGLCFHINCSISVKKYGTEVFEEQPQTVLVGPQVTPVFIKTSTHYKAIRLGFQPGALYRILHTDLNTITDKSFDAELIFGPEMRELNRKLDEAINDNEIKIAIEGFLLKKIATNFAPAPIDYAIIDLVRADGNISIKALADKACLSVRQFERQCIRRLGMNPKTYARITRFSKAYRLREKSPDLTWAKIAYECGYTEQMQLIKDVKEFAGINPKKLEKEIALTTFKMQAHINV